MKKLFVIIILLITGSINFLKAQSNNSFYEESHQKHRKVIPLQYVREDDVTWRYRIWREINFGEKLNQFFYYPTTPAQGRVNFITMLDNAVTEEGTIPAYSDDDCIMPQSIETIKGGRSDNQPTQIPDPNDPDLLIDTVISIPQNINDVKVLRVKEDWFIDKQRGVQEVRILSICPVLFVTKGDEVLAKPMYWVKFDDCRPIFVENEAYNMYNNDVQRLSYDDIFMKRMFASTITKETNVKDRKIDEYLEGIDALLEAQAIKEKVFEREQAMWEY